MKEAITSVKSHRHLLCTLLGWVYALMKMMVVLPGGKAVGVSAVGAPMQMHDAF